MIAQDTALKPAPTKKGRPVLGEKKLTAAQRQKRFRDASRNAVFESCKGHNLSVPLCGEAAQALAMLCFEPKLSHKEVIEKLLIEAYSKKKEL